VAVKKFRNPDPTVTTSLLDSLLQESVLFSKLRHPNVVLFLGICTEEPNVVRKAPKGIVWIWEHKRDLK